MVGEHRRPTAEEALDDIRGLFGHRDALVAHGRELEPPSPDRGERSVGANVATSHASTSDQTHGKTTHLRAPNVQGR